MRYLTNRKVLSEFFVSETFSGGMALFGYEVKSIKNGLGDLAGSRCVVRGEECFVTGMYIPPYQKKNTDTAYDPYRTRKVIVTKKEIHTLAQYEATKGISLLPLSLYSKGRLIKVDIGVARRKNPRDRRLEIRKKIEKRERKDGV